jgi:hypothetical protein
MPATRKRRSELRRATRSLLRFYACCALYACGLVRCEEACIPGRSDPGCYTVERAAVAQPQLRSSSAGITLVTQTTLSKLPRFEHALRTWSGFVSVALYAYDSEEREAFLRYSCANCTVTVVHGGRRKQPYPINLLRNIALQHAPTDLIFTLDADFLPSPGMYERLLQIVPTPLEGKVFVVPAFELTQALPAPSGYAALTAAMANGTVRVFHDRRGGFHKYTRTATWLTRNASYCLNKTGPNYEPYIVANKTNAGFPGYDTSFVDRGMNKISWIQSIKQQRFRFCVLPHVYVVHEWEMHAHYLPFYVTTTQTRSTHSERYVTRRGRRRKSKAKASKSKAPY